MTTPDIRHRVAECTALHDLCDGREFQILTILCEPASISRGGGELVPKERRARADSRAHASGRCAGTTVLETERPHHRGDRLQADGVVGDVR